MGKHSLPGSGGFWRSLVSSLLRWFLLIAIPVAVGVGMWLFVFEPRRDVDVAEDPEVTSTATLGLSPNPDPFETTTTVTAGPSPSPTQRNGRVQVLNGTSNSELATKMTDRLRSVGYEIVSSSRASRSYEKTTVFFQEGQETLAREVAEVAGASVVQPAPSNLDRSVPVTVVVGADFTG